MIDKSQQQAIKEMCQSGAIALIEAVCEEMKKDIGVPTFKGSQAQLVYDTGEANGISKGLDLLIDNIRGFATKS